MNADRSRATAEERGVLAPTGSLRVGLYSGSPTSYLAADGAHPQRGMGFLLGREMARWLAIPFEPVVHARNADLLQAVRSDEVDLVFTNATDERAKYIHFSSALLALEKSVLVPPDSSIGTLGELSAQGRRIGFSAGSSTAAEFGRVCPGAFLVEVKSLAEAASRLAGAELDGFATNKPILHQLAEAIGGGRILEGAWGMEHLALGIPIARGAARPCLQGFARWAAEGGAVGEAIVRSGMQGLGLAAHRPG